MNPTTLLPRGTTPTRCAPETARDLGLDSIAAWLAGPTLGQADMRRLLTVLPRDPAAVRRRQAVFRDIDGDASLRDGLTTIVGRMHELTAFTRSVSEAETPFLAAIWRLGELELFVDVVDELAAVLSRPDHRPRSEDLRRLGTECDAARRDPVYRRLRETLPGLRRGLRSKRSVTIGINLDDRLRPVEAALLAIHDRPVTRGGLAGTLFGGDRERLRAAGEIHRSAGPPNVPLVSDHHVPLAPLFSDLEQLLKSVARPLLRGVREFLSVRTDGLRRLLPELALYLGAAAARDDLTAAGLPSCVPEVASGEPGIRARGLYNLHLARRSDRSRQRPGEAIVPSDVALGDGAPRFAVLTGPNQGGKTTFVQAIGIAQVLFQAGLFVPAEKATMSPVDAIETHFPAAEHGSLDTGRLDGELSRLSQSIDRLGTRSLLLLNETFSGTSAREGAYLARELLAGLARIGALGVFATHLHDAADSVDAIAAQQGTPGVLGNLRAEVRLEAGSAVRTFRITPGQPPGTSYAADLASRHGLTADDIVRRTRRTASE